MTQGDVCPNCGRTVGSIEQQTGVCCRCGLHWGGVKCTCKRVWPTVVAADRCDQQHRNAA